MSNPYRPAHAPGHMPAQRIPYEGPVRQQPAPREAPGQGGAYRQADRPPTRPYAVETADGEIVSLRKPTPKESAKIRSATRIIKIPASPAPPAAIGSAPGKSAGPVQLEFLDSGWIVGAIFDSKNAGTPAQRSSLGVQIITVGNTSAITSGTRERAFIPVSLLCPDT